ncbi:MAG: response regulator [Pirellulales bacterium]
MMASGLKIAVADDEPLIRRFFEDVLPDMGHTVVGAAENGRQLVELCRRTPPDLVIADIKMPEMDGIEAAIEIMRERAVPVLLVSAFHDDDLSARAEASQVMGYLVKPVDRAQLELAIRLARSRFEKIESLERETVRLRQALEDRKLIEKAKGVLMRTANLAEDAAMRKMQKMASDSNRKLTAVAQMIVDAGPTLDLLRDKG